MLDSSQCQPPQATAREVEMLDQIDRLTAIAQADADAAPDVLTESLDTERLLAESRTQTWLTWFEGIR